MIDLDRLRKAVAWYKKADPWHNVHSDVMAEAARLLLGAETGWWQCAMTDTLTQGQPIQCSLPTWREPHKDCGWRLSIPWPGEVEA